MPGGFPGALVHPPRGPCQGACDDAGIRVVRGCHPPAPVTSKVGLSRCGSRAGRHAGRARRCTAPATLVGGSWRRTAMPSSEQPRTHNRTVCRALGRAIARNLWKPGRSPCPPPFRDSLAVEVWVSSANPTQGLTPQRCHSQPRRVSGRHRQMNAGHSKATESRVCRLSSNSKRHRRAASPQWSSRTAERTAGGEEHTSCARSHRAGVRG